MNKTIIQNFNSILTQEDDLYLLGDTIMGHNIEVSLSYIQSLNTKIHLIWGNHCTENRQKALMTLPNVIEICGWSNILKYNKYHFYLSHFPSCTSNFDDYKKPLKQRLLSLSGHTHSKEHFESTFSYNVSVDAHNNFPVSIEQIIQEFIQLEWAKVDKNKS